MSNNRIIKAVAEQSLSRWNNVNAICGIIEKGAPYNFFILYRKRSKNIISFFTYNEKTVQIKSIILGATFIFPF